MGFLLSEKFVKEKSGWGGKRAGAGRPKGYKPPPRPPKPEEEKIRLNLNAIQRKSLEEMGQGSVSKGIQKLIDEHL